MQRDGGPKVSAPEIARPDEKLLQEARIKAVVGAERRNVGDRGAGRDHHRDRVAGGDTQQNEDHHGHANHGDRRHAQAVQDRLDHT